MNRKTKMKLIFVCVALVLVCVILYSGLQILESTVFPNQQDGPGRESKWIERNGVKYYPRQDIETLLILGVDRDHYAAEGHSSRESTADIIALLILDKPKEECTLLLLNRDTMVVEGGNDSSAENQKLFQQLAFSHEYGSTCEEGCKNVRDTVSKLLYGITIDHYISLDMAGIATLNDAVGGVTVQVVDDFSVIDPSIAMGAFTLWGHQAASFVGTYTSLDEQLNLTRMERHKTYFNGLMEALRTKMSQSPGFALSLHKKIDPYLVTDCSVNTLAGILDRYADCRLKEIVSPEGENVGGEAGMEYYLDEEKLDALILRLFYAPQQ